MIRADKIKNSFYKEVGFNTPTLSLNLSDNTDLVVDADNLTSYSGLYFDDINFVSIQNIFDCQENTAITNAQFNALLKRMSEDSIVQFCNKVVAGENDHIQSENLFPYEKSFNDTLDLGSDFVAFKIEPYCVEDKALKIPWLEICLTESVQFYVYLFNSNLKTYIQRIQVTASAEEAKIVNLVDSNNKPWLVVDDDTYKGGNYYIGYFESDLGTAKPYKKDWELASVQKVVSDYYIAPVKVEHNSNVLDIESETEVAYTYGLNIGVEVYKDYTQLLINNKQSLLEGYKYQMAEKVLNMIKSSTRSNPTADKLKEEAVLGELNAMLYGNAALGIEGIQGFLKRQVDDIKRTFFYKPRIVKTTLR